MSCDTDQGTFDFPATYEGGSLKSFDISIAEESGTTLASAIMVFKLADSDTAALTLTSGDGLTLTATTAGAWTITVDEITPVTLAPGVYFYNLKTTDSDGVIEYYLAGTWEIKDV